MARSLSSFVNPQVGERKEKIEEKGLLSGLLKPTDGRKLQDFFGKVSDWLLCVLGPLVRFVSRLDFLRTNWT